MKKVSIFMAIAAAASLASCTAQAPKANLKSDIVSLSYSIGMAQTQGLYPACRRTQVPSAQIHEHGK